MRVLVTGGAGFIGSHLSERLLRDGHQVVILDQLNHYYSPALKLWNLDEVRKCGPVTFVQGDICDLRAVTNLMSTQKIEAVAHLAALVGVGPSLEQPVEYQNVNVGGTTALLEAARISGIEKFVFASSSSVYGETKNTPFREDDTGTFPISPYGATKLAAERMCYVYAYLYKLPVICLRLFTVYGPRQRPDLALCKFVRLMESEMTIPVHGDGSTCRDYTFCGDITKGIVAALQFQTQFDVFNLGSSRPIALADMIRTLESILGRRAKIDWLPEKPGDLRMTHADIAKAERLLGYRSATPFDEGARQLVAWFRDQYSTSGLSQ